MIEAAHVQETAEFFAEIVAGENECPAGMLLFSESEQIRGIANLRFDLFFAVPEIIVGDDGDNHAASVATGDLEGGAVVVEFVVALPAHAVALLAFGRFVEMRKACVLLCDGDEM